jgi:pilus assembly protein Flp/PilA
LKHLRQTEQPGALGRALRGIPSSYKDFLRDESGQDLIEYVLVAALLSLAAIMSSRNLGTALSSAYGSIASNLTSNT